MDMEMNNIQQLITLLLVAIALGMDAMSLGFGIGMKGLSKREIIKISLTIGLFHVIMPLIGSILGLYLHKIVGDITKVFGAILLILFGIQMIYYSFRPEHKTQTQVNKTTGLGLLLFAMSVSIDALSVGFSLGLFEVNIGLIVSLFGIVGGFMAAIGLTIGSRISHILGNYSEILGGTILIVFGIKFLY